MGTCVSDGRGSRGSARVAAQARRRDCCYPGRALCTRKGGAGGSGELQVGGTPAGGPRPGFASHEQAEGGGPGGPPHWGNYDSTTIVSHSASGGPGDGSGKHEPGSH